MGLAKRGAGRHERRGGRFQASSGARSRAARAFMGCTVRRCSRSAVRIWRAASSRQSCRAIRLDFDANLNLGVLLRNEQDNDRALPYLTRALGVRPGDLATRYQIASLTLARQDVAAATEMLEAIVKEAPTFVEAHVALGNGVLSPAAQGRRRSRTGDRRATEPAERDRGRSCRLERIEHERTGTPAPTRSPRCSFFAAGDALGSACAGPARPHNCLSFEPGPRRSFWMSSFAIAAATRSATFSSPS